MSEISRSEADYVNEGLMHLQEIHREGSLEQVVREKWGSEYEKRGITAGNQEGIRTALYQEIK